VPSLALPRTPTTPPCSTAKRSLHAVSAFGVSALGQVVAALTVPPPSPPGVDRQADQPARQEGRAGALEAFRRSHRGDLRAVRGNRFVVDSTRSSDGAAALPGDDGLVIELNSVNTNAALRVLASGIEDLHELSVAGLPRKKRSMSRTSSARADGARAQPGDGELAAERSQSALDDGSHVQTGQAVHRCDVTASVALRSRKSECARAEGGTARLRGRCARDERLRRQMLRRDLSFGLFEAEANVDTRRTTIRTDRQADSPRSA
jgi:hypothetical protein